MNSYRKLHWRLLLASIIFALLTAAVLYQTLALAQQKIDLTEQQLIEHIKNVEFIPMQKKIEDIFKAMYQNARTISLMPSVQNIQGKNRQGEKDNIITSHRFSEEADRTVQQLYNNLASNLNVSEVYAVIEGLDYKQGEIPFFMYDTIKLNISKNAGNDLLSKAKTEEKKDSDTPEELEDREYEYYPIQISKLKAIYPVFNYTSLDQIPAISSPLIRTCDNNQYYSIKTCNVYDASGILYSIPFYNKYRKNLTGIISVIIRSNVFEATLLKVPYLILTAKDIKSAQTDRFSMPDNFSPFALKNDTNKIEITDRRNTEISAALKNTPHQGKVFKERLNINDESSWVLYYYLSPSKIEESLSYVHKNNTRILSITMAFMLLFYLFTLYYIYRRYITECELNDLQKIEKTIIAVSNDFDLTLRAEGLITKKATETSGALNYLLTTLADMINSLRDAESQLHFQATRDSLTGLPNRALLLDRIQLSIARSKRADGKIALFFIDLNKFKFINDSLGHAAGDLVLQEISKRLLALSREEDTVARLGGDEFVLAYEVPNIDAIQPLSERLLTALHTSIMLSGSHYTLGGSVGIAIYPEHGEDAESLLKHADIAMYKAKKNRDNKACIFDSEMQNTIDQRLQMEARLRNGIIHGELVLHYQPQIDIKTGALISLEALVRWNSPHYGFLTPFHFIPLAEESTLIDKIDNFVLDAVCAQIQNWHQRGFGWIRVAVNLAATKFSDPGFECQLKTCLDHYGLPAGFLELEVTEGLAIKDPDAMLSLMHKLKAMGVQLAIDDFGTGYSNLGYLKRFPTNRLKIDQSFICGLLSNPQDRAIVMTIIQLAHNLSMRTIAEGVETEEEATQLYALGVDEIQGYWISKPIPAAAVEKLFSRYSLIDSTQLVVREQIPTVLIVEDNPVSLEIMVLLLSSFGVKIISASSSEQALILLQQQTELSLAIVDYQLPGENGIQFLARLKQLFPQTSRVMLTASDEPSVMRDAINIASVNHFMNKPIDPGALKQLVMAACWDRLTQSQDFKRCIEIHEKSMY